MNNQNEHWVRITISPEDHPVFHIFWDCSRYLSIERHNRRRMIRRDALLDGRSICGDCDTRLRAQIERLRQRLQRLQNRLNP